MEPRDTTAVDKTLASYSATATAAKSTLLMAVAGGKLSEGINFADNLGRCVVMVGLPYANPHAPAMRAQLKYIKAKGGDADSYLMDR